MQGGHQIEAFLSRIADMSNWRTTNSIEEYETKERLRVRSGDEELTGEWNVV